MDPPIQFYGLSMKAHADTVIVRVTIISTIKLEKFTNYVYEV